ncbi:UTRA domain-containing protein [Tatumella sp. JGM130]|uniref:UTRA domain-containing protein n=1 Tax=Tatumella sp. JGM130 TaxID=2799797 RepID=UPI001BAFEE18|nr:UTRA domain-containing protein [Tatumella sp. JGM130]MBS0893364.1 UTRA domain-containing protein [Tatumella sp. JGM130]
MIAGSLLQRVEKGEFAQGRLPSERCLSEQYATTRITLREALALLETHGKIYRELRRGWFIAPPRLVYNPLLRRHFHEMAAQQGRLAHTEVISCGEISATPLLAQQLSVTAGEALFCIRRLRRIDGRAVLYVEHYLNPQFFPGLLQEDLTRSLTDLYQSLYGIRYGGVRFTVLPGPLPAFSAPALNVASGSPGICITRINQNQHHQVIDCDHEYWRYDALCVDVET